MRATFSEVLPVGGQWNSSCYQIEQIVKLIYKEYLIFFEPFKLSVYFS